MLEFKALKKIKFKRQKTRKEKEFFNKKSNSELKNYIENLKILLMNLL